MRRRSSPDFLRLSCLLPTFLWLPGPALEAQSVRVSPGTIEDRRTTGKFFAGLEIELKLTGDDLADAKAARVLVKKAVDETGRDLISEQRDEDFKESYGGGAPSLKVNLKNPARGASAVKEVSGEVQLFAPGRDPAATAVVDKLLSRMDKPLASPALKSMQIEVKLISAKVYQANAKKTQAEFEKEMEKNKEEMKKQAQAEGADDKEVEAMMALAKGLMGMMGEVGENDLIFEIKDPQKRLFEIEVLNKDGERIDRQGSMSSGDTKILHFSEKVPADAKLRFLIKTEKSMVRAPFAMKDVPLP